MKRVMEESKRTADAETSNRLAREAAQAAEVVKAQAEAKLKKEEEEAQARAAAAESASRAEAAAAANSSSLPAIGGLPSLGGHKPKNTGLALFEDIDISETDAVEVVEEKSQKKQLRDEKVAMIAERNAERA